MKLTKFTTLLLITLLTLANAQTIWDGTADTDWYTDNPELLEFTITTAEQLAGLRQLANSGNTFSEKTITLGADIALNDTNANGGWQNWENNPPTNIWTAIGNSAIGNSSNAFQGTFDGNGYVISGIYINTNVIYQGLFGHIGISGSIKNLGVLASYIIGSSYVGCLVGSNNGTIINSKATGTVIGNFFRVGGFAGVNTGTITNSYATGTVMGNNYYVGGFVGSNTGTITNSYATGTVTGNMGIGGLVGYNNRGTITNSYAMGKVTGTEYSIGGLVGDNQSGIIIFSHATGMVVGEEYVGDLVGYSDSDTIANCYATGAVTGIEYVGGLVGINWGTIANSYATGAVTGNSRVGGLVASISEGTIINSYATGKIIGEQYVGGLVGISYTIITNSYATGHVTGNNRVGGLAGASTTVNNSFYNKETSGQSDTGKGIGKTTVEMKNILTYTSVDWDFVDIWYIQDGITYPHLKWQFTDLSSCCTIANIPEQIYTGSAITPNFVIMDGEAELTNNDYNTIFANNINVGTATITIEGKGNYISTITENFKIIQKEIASADIIVSSIPAQIYAESEIYPAFEIKYGSIKLIEDIDYIYEYKNNIEIGTATITVNGVGNYSGIINIEFEIISAPSPILISQTATVNNIIAMQNAVNIQVKNTAVLQIYDINGKQQKTLNFKSGNYNVPLNDLPNGIYIIKASFNSENSSSYKILQTVLK